MMADRPGQSGTQRGFTLIEMLLVLSLIALTVAAIVPTTTRSRQAVELRTAGVQFVARLNAVRSQAIRESAERSMLIDVASARYWSPGVIRAATLPNGIGFAVEGGEAAGQQRTVRFSPEGRALPTRIQLRSTSGMLLVTIDGMSGVARVEGR